MNLFVQQVEQTTASLLCILIIRSILEFVCWTRQWHPTPVLLPGKSHGRRGLVGCSPWGREESDTAECHFHFSLSCIGGGNGNPLRCSCLENPRDGGAWWAAVYGVAQSRTRLTRLSSSSRVCVWRVFYAATASVNSKCNTEKKSSVIPMNDGVGQTWPSRRMCILLKIERRKSGQRFSCLNYLRNFHIACSGCASRDPDRRLQYY